MILLRATSICLGLLLLATAASAQTSLAPPAAEKPAAKPERKAEPKSEAKARKPAPSASATPAPASTPDDPNVDVVYTEFQKGRYKTTFNLAIPRAQAGDPHAMTMLGELYSNGLGVKRDYAKALD